MAMRFLRDKLEAYRAERRYRDTDADWAEMRTSIQKRPMATGLPKRLVIVPSDPWTLTGARGDEAMIRAVVSQLRGAVHDLKVGIVTGCKAASDAARGLGYEPIQVWHKPLKTEIDAIQAFQADCLAVLGADCMDGYYSADTALGLLAIADVSSRLGVRSTILGFSFNDQPATRLAAAFDAVDERVAINVRDEVSLQRFKRFTSAKARLVTDSAFMLEPVTDTPPVLAVSAWAHAQRSAGQQVLGFNVHPMLLKDPCKAQVSALIENVRAALHEFMKSTQVSIALISHDYRGDRGDDVCLRPLAASLIPEFGARVFYIETQCSAGELKGIAGLMDGVVTGRMHLAIASLGMGTPVAALTYQDKFQGLMRHFDLPQDLLLPPEKLVSPDSLFALLSDFSRNISSYNGLVADHLPSVKKLAAVNVDQLLN